MFIESLTDMANLFVVHETGTFGFYMGVTVFFFTAILVVWLLFGAFDKDKSVFVCIFAFWIPLAAALAGAAGAEVYLVPMISDTAPDWLRLSVTWSIFALILLLSVAFVSAKMIGMSFLGTLFVFLLAGLVGAGSCYGLGVWMPAPDEDGEQPLEGELSFPT